jgi:hypothetical protein
MSDGREEREEREKRLEEERRQNREDWIDQVPVDQWEPEREDSWVHIQRQQQIPFGNDNQKSKSNGKDGVTAGGDSRSAGSVAAAGGSVVNSGETLRLI